jgi:hypothetical protein
MVKKGSIFTAIIVAVLAIVVMPVMAAPPLFVHIEALEYVNTSGEVFEITGSAVESGIVCPVGTTADISIQVAGPPEGAFRNLTILKRFTCDDSSGTFDLMLNVRLDLTTHETIAQWRVVSGTGDYTNLHGRGYLVGIPIDPGVSIFDVYDGTMN